MIKYTQLIETGEVLSNNNTHNRLWVLEDNKRYLRRRMYGPRESILGVPDIGSIYEIRLV